MEKPNRSKGKTCPVTPRSCGADTGRTLNSRGNPVTSISHPLFPQNSRVHGVEMEKPNHSKGKPAPSLPIFAGRTRGAVGFLRGRTGYRPEQPCHPSLFARCRRAGPCRPRRDEQRPLSPPSQEQGLDLLVPVFGCYLQHLPSLCGGYDERFTDSF